MMWDEHVEIDFSDCDVEIEGINTEVVKVDFTSQDHDRAIQESIKRNEEKLRQQKYNGSNGTSNGGNGNFVRRNGGGSRRGNKLNFQEDGSLPKDSKGNEIIYGREIDMPITPMKDVDVYTGQVAIRGRVVGIEIKEIANEKQYAHSI